MSVAERLEKFLKEHGYSKADAAKLSGIPYTTIDGLFKKGDENIKLSTLKKLASFMQCTLDELAGDAEPEGYYQNVETSLLAQELKDNPQYRALLDSSKKLKPEGVKEVMNFINYQLQKEKGELDE